MDRKRYRLVQRRKVVGLSQEGLAEAVGVDRSTEARWERGETTPQPCHRPRLAEALKVSAEEVDALLALADDSHLDHAQPAGSAEQADDHGKAAPAMADNLHQTAWLHLDRAREAAQRLWRHELAAPRSSGLDAEAVESLILRWLISNPEPSVSFDGERRVGLTDVERLRSVGRELKAMDNSYGGGTAFPMTLAFLRGEAGPLLHGRYDDATGRALFGAVAELTLDLGWMAYDAGDHLLARTYMGQSLRMAHAADDRLFGGRVLAAMSHQALHVGQIQLAIDCARAARAGTEHVAPRRVLAMTAAMEAMAQAAAEQAPGCRAALRDAEAALERADDGIDPAWVDFDEGGLWGHAARAYRYLGKGGECVRFAEQSIAACRSDHGRTRAQRYAILAAGYVRQGELDQAAATGEQIIREAWQLRSRHVDEEITGLAKVIRQRKPGGGSDFLAQAGEYLAVRPV